MNIVLIGYRGTGKSTVGRMTAELLGFPLIETDSEIETRAEKTIPEIVKEYSWDYFRDLESKVINDVASHDKAVIDCGGGVVIRTENIAVLRKSGLIFLLRAEVEDIIRRISSTTHRPSLTGTKSFTEEVMEVLREREPRYQAAADYIIDTSKESPRTAADKIADLYQKKVARQESPRHDIQS